MFTFENQGTNTYLVYSVTQDDEIDTMSLGMLTNNKIAGLAPVLYTQMDTEKYIKYNVSAKISAKQFFTGAVNSKRLIGVFTGIVSAMLSAEDYMIDSNAIILDLDYIFADVSTCETVLICLPVSMESEKQDLGLFFKNIMFSTQFDQTENCDYVAKIINYLNSTPVFSLADFKKILDGLKGGQSTQTQPEIKKVSSPIVDTIQTKQPIVQQPSVPQVQSVQPPKPSASVVRQPVSPPPVKQQIPAVPNVQPQSATESSNEKQMSWFYLMQHYNAENAAIYKAQKASKKTGAVPSPSVPKPSKGQEIPTPKTSNVGFAIPGQQIPMPANTVNAQPQQPVKQPVMASAQVKQQNPAPFPQTVYTPPVAPQGQSMNFGETTVLGGGGKIGETTVLNAGAQADVAPKPYLIRAKNNEKILLNKPVFRIGKEKSYVDYFISDNTAISRSHANIIERDGKFYVVDTNSTNHTFVGGQMIQSNTEVEIVHGTTIRLANEDFEFKLF
ncbi:MAG: DUF6382 domain-containing protein [Eubacteriales bacterium]|nr:DUF6382 domain-containing protein [Eubacteriales bacterium]